MNRYEKESAARRIADYYPHYSAHMNVMGKQSEAFTIAKQEALKHLRAALEQTEKLTDDEFFAVTKYFRGKGVDEWLSHETAPAEQEQQA